MYITQMILNANNIDVLRMLINRQKLHVFVQSFFNSAREDYNVQYAVYEGKSNVVLMIRSDIEPDAEKKNREFILSFETCDISNFYKGIQNGYYVRFSITMPIVKKIDSCKNKINIEEPERRKEKFCDIMSAAGLSVDIKDGQNFVEEPKEKIYFKDKNAFYKPYKYTGIARVSDVDSLLNSLKKGIGRGKAYGLGMLDVMPA